MITKRCPKCGGKLKLIGTKSYPRSGVHMIDHEYRRRRIMCLECGWRYNTYEVRQDDFLHLVRERKKADKIVNRTELAIRNLKEAMNKIKNDN